MSVSDLGQVGVVTLHKAWEPRLDIKADRDFIAVMGAANISTQSFTANSASTGSIIWSQTTPAVRNGVDRRVELDVTARITPVFSGGEQGVAYRIVPMQGDIATGDAGAQAGIRAGLRAYPLHSVLQTVQVRLNDQAFFWEPAEQIHALLEYGLTPEDRQYSMGSTPHYPDQQWRYATNTPNRSVFNSYMNSLFEDSRNAGIWMEGGGSDAQGNPLDMSVRMVEGMILSPFAYAENVQCLFGIQNIDVSLTFRQPLDRMLCGLWMPNMIQRNATPADPNTWVALTAADDGLVFNPQFTFDQTGQKIHLTYLQPQINQIIPWRLNYPFWQIQKFSQDIGGQIAARGTFTVNYNNITLNNIPKRMYLFAQPQLIQSGGNVPAQPNYYGNRADNLPAGDGNCNALQTDTFAAIERLTVNFDTQDGRFSTYDTYDLYKMAQNNGLKRSYQAWQNYVGSVLALEFGKDLNLNPLLCPGVRGNFQLAASVAYRDIRNAGRTASPEDPEQTQPKFYKAFMIIVNTGIVTIQNQLITSSIGSLTEIQVEDAGWLREGFRSTAKNVAGEGISLSNIYSGLKHAMKKIGPFISPVADVVGEIAGLSDDHRAQTASKIAKAVSKASKGRGRQSGGNIVVGGKRLSSHSLSRRM